MEIQLLATFEIDATLRDRFRLGELSREWQTKYPDIFDDDDLRLALSQPNNHFYEWAAAIHLCEKQGYLSLLEKYQFKNHKRKLSILKKLEFDDLQKALEYQRLKKSMQAPDLLVYKPDFSDWFFCEVKGGADRLREVQKSHFEILSALSGKPIYLIKINPTKS